MENTERKCRGIYITQLKKYEKEHQNSFSYFSDKPKYDNSAVTALHKILDIGKLILVSLDFLVCKRSNISLIILPYNVENSADNIASKPSVFRLYQCSSFLFGLRKPTHS